MPRSTGEYRYQLRALTSLARYLPVYIGLMLAATFTLSVLYDGSDTGAAAYRAGADLLGLYGGFGAVVLPFLLLATARLRRGRPEPIVSSKLVAGALELVVRGRRRDRKVTIANRRVKSAYAYAPMAGRTKLSLELEGPDVGEGAHPFRDARALEVAATGGRLHELQHRRVMPLRDVLDELLQRELATRDDADHALGVARPCEFLGLRLRRGRRGGRGILRPDARDGHGEEHGEGERDEQGHH